jgi:hypothetical protein
VSRPAPDAWRQAYEAAKAALDAADAPADAYQALAEGFFGGARTPRFSWMTGHPVISILLIMVVLFFLPLAGAVLHWIDADTEHLRLQNQADRDVTPFVARSGAGRASAPPPTCGLDDLKPEYKAHPPAPGQPVGPEYLIRATNDRACIFSAK